MIRTPTDDDDWATLSLCLGQKIEYFEDWFLVDDAQTIVHPAASEQCGWIASEHTSHCTAPKSEQTQQGADVIFEEKAEHRG